MCKLLLDKQDYIEELRNENYDIGLTSIYDSCGIGLFHVLGIKSTAMYSATHLSDPVIWTFGLPMSPSYLSDWLNWQGVGEKMNFLHRLNNIIFMTKLAFKLEYLNKGEQQVFEDRYPNFPNDQRVKAFITHSGLNSYIEAAHAGVPLVTIPLFTDQSYNANAAIFAGMAILLRKNNITKKSIAYALEEVLHNSKYLQNAKEISKLLANSPMKPQEIFVKHVELAARFPNISSYLQLASTELGMWTYFCMDKAWNEISLEALVKIVDNFPKRLKACIDANGVHFE
uniref:glucuronosyltransferase n=2 Tax=Acrobeloides nanus TaxID=290746 RepID=A0A914D4W7_9BILA